MKTYTSNELLTKLHPIKKFFLKPLFFPRSLSMLYAAPGIGKTFTSLWMAAAIAGKGHFLKWQSEEVGRVLYVDGEMGSEELQERLGKLAVAVDFPIAPENLNFICPDDENNGEIPLMSDVTSHKFYLEQMQSRDVMIVDNYGCLTSRKGRESDEDVWNNCWMLLKKLRAKGKSILIVHHAGKGGAQLGTSKKEHPLNWMIELTRPIFYEPSMGARFELKFTKCRGIKGPDLDTLTVELLESPEKFSWSWANRDVDMKETMLKMRAVGMTDQQIAFELNTGLFFVKKTLSEPPEIPNQDSGAAPYLYDESEAF